MLTFFQRKPQQPGMAYIDGLEFLVSKKPTELMVIRVCYKTYLHFGDKADYYESKGLGRIRKDNYYNLFC